MHVHTKTNFKASWLVCILFPQDEFTPSTRPQIVVCTIGVKYLGLQIHQTHLWDSKTLHNNLNNNNPLTVPIRVYEIHT